MTSYTIPLQIISLDGDGYHLLMEIFLFGETHFAVLDTGASKSVFDKSLILNHTETTSKVNGIQANTLFSTTETLQATVPLLKIGSLKIKDFQTLAIDLSSVSETYAQFGHPAVAAIIGGDVLMEYNAKIDYATNTLRLYKYKAK